MTDCPTAGSSTTETDTPHPGWPLWQRLAFRFALVYWLLYALPFPFDRLTSLISSGLHQLGEVSWLGSAREPLQEAASWIRENVMGTVLGAWEESWQAVTSFLSERGVVPLAVIHQPTGSGDTAHDLIKLGCIAILALVAMTTWSAIDRRPRRYERTSRWLHLGARWWLAFWMVIYGSIKLYTGQFPDPGPWQLTREIGDKSPMGMVWTFMGASPAYEAFGGIGETLGGLLLFHRRTALLGALVTIAVMTNVVALNWLYDVPVKLFSANLLLCAVLLLAPWRAQLWALVIRNRAAMPADLAVTKGHTSRLLLHVFGTTWIAIYLVLTHVQGLEAIDNFEKRMPRPAYFGLWTVQEMTRDGEEVPDSDSSRWELVAFDRRMQVWTKNLKGDYRFYTCTQNVAAGTMTLKGRSSKDVPASWTVVEGTRTVTEAHPAPRTMADYSRTVEVSRPSLTLRGELDGSTYEIVVAEKTVRLHRGFHLVQEMPFNR